jgi:hypothetical protein
MESNWILKLGTWLFGMYVCQFLFMYDVFLSEEESSCFQNVLCVCARVREREIG